MGEGHSPNGIAGIVSSTLTCSDAVSDWPAASAATSLPLSVIRISCPTERRSEAANPDYPSIRALSGSTRLGCRRSGSAPQSVACRLLADCWWLPRRCRPSNLDDMAGATTQRSFEIRTYGCQMNMHDSERLAGLLEAAGYRRASAGADPDVVVFNTCAVRENADNRLYGNLGHLLPLKNSRPGMQIAVGGCLAQKDRATITQRAPWVDVVFGTHNIGSL